MMQKLETSDKYIVDLAESMEREGIDPSEALRAGIKSVVAGGRFFSRCIENEKKNLSEVGVQ